MNSPGNEKNKLILIALLSLVFVLVAYVRFFHNAGIHGTSSPVAPVGTFAAVLQPPGVGAGPGGETLDTNFPAPRTITRDIFAPGRVEFVAGGSKESPQGTGEAMPELMFKLSGVMADQGSAIAIINGKFLKKGDWIEEYQLIGIYDGKVVLNGNGGQKIVLNLLKTMDKQF
ncbi:MAG: hypothetical protein HY742_04015 [Deltaproteobacteria bacterium]|nr:hypothetical protein [Deltaproteobacteria bacterium]